MSKALSLRARSNYSRTTVRKILSSSSRSRLAAFLILAALTATAVYTATSSAHRSPAPKAAAGHTLNNAVTVGGMTLTQNFAFSPVVGPTCLTDTTQADFEGGTLTNVDTTTSPGDVTLSGNTSTLDQQNTNVTASGAAFNTTTWVGQTFTPSVTGQLTRVDVDLLCSGCTETTPDITVSIRATTGNAPSGDDLATATIPGFSSSTPTFYTADFATPATLTAGTIYSIVVRADADPSVGTYGYVFSGGNAYLSGRRATSINSGSTWTGQTNDIGFKTYMLAGYAASGSVVSSVKDSNPGSAIPKWTTISWTTTVPASTNITFQAAASNSPAGPFSFVGPDGTAGSFFTSGGSLAQFNGNRYLKYKAVLSTTNSAVTPTLHDVTVCYENSLPPTLTVSPATGIYGDTVDLSATLTDSGGNPIPDKVIAFTINGDADPSNEALTDENGVATVEDASIVGINAGTYPNGIGATFAGDATYASASGSNTLTITRASTATSVTSNNNPSAGNEPVTFTATVTSGEGIPTGTVTFKDGANTLGTSPLNGSAQATLTTSLPQGTHSITAEYNGNTNLDVSTSPALTQEVTEALSTCVNVAAASYGATASASSTFGPGYEASGAIDGNHKGNNWGTGVGWNDGTQDTFPDTLTINLGAPQQVNEIYVYSLQDNYLNPSEPVESMTFTLYGLTNFQVQVPDGMGGWMDVPGGNITGNNKVRRRVIFASPVTTDQIRVVVNNTSDNIWSRVVEVEAYSCSAPPPPTPTPTPTPCTTNVAAASYGATAIASSEAGPGYAASGAIDGNRAASNWGTGTGWNDGTAGVYPDNLVVNLGVTQSLSEIDVYSLQDNYTSPVEPTDTMTFTAYGLTDFQVQVPDGVGGWMDVPGGHVTNNNLVKRRVIFSSPVSTDQIRILVNASADAVYSRIAEVEAFSCSAVPGPTPTPTPTPCTTNVAAASYGATATASSEISPNYPASGAIDGNHTGAGWGTGVGWNDATAGVYPDNLVVNLNATQAISEVDVYSLQDNYTSPVEPTDTTMFTSYGLTNFQVQIPDGVGGWTTVPGGNITGNNLVKRKVIFASPVSTNQIRILVNSSADGVYSRIVEVEAFSCTPVLVSAPRQRSGQSADIILAGHGQKTLNPAALSEVINALLDDHAPGEEYVRAGRWRIGQKLCLDISSLIL